MSKQQWYTATGDAEGKTIRVRGELIGKMIENWTAIVREAANGLIVWETRQGNAGWADSQEEGIGAAMNALGIRASKES